MIYEIGSGTGLYCIEGMGAHVYFIARPEPMLVDTGGPGQGANVLRALASIGVQPIYLRKIVLTHHHLGHVGGLALIKQRSGAQVYAHPADIPFISGKLKRRAPRNPAERVFQSAVAWTGLTDARPEQVDRRADEDILICGWRVIHTPGHTAGHICLLKDDVLIGGDLLQATAKGFRELPAALTADPAAARRSIVKIAGLQFEAFLPGHNPPYVFNACARVQELAARLTD